MLNVVQLMMPYKSNAYLLKLLLCGLFAVFSAISYAEDNSYESLVKSYSSTLDKIEHNLSKQVYDEKTLPATIRPVTSIKSEALGCVSLESADLEKLENDLNTLGTSSTVESARVKEKRSELNNAILKTQKLLGSCRVILLRSD